MGSAWLVLCVLSGAVGAERPVYSDRPNRVAFPPQEARFVRFVIHDNTSAQPCVDELEVYAEQEGAEQDAAADNLALAEHGAKATASSCFPNNPKHRVEHLNDGRYGNSHSWISAGKGGEWAQIELPAPARVASVVFSRDRLREYADRMPFDFEVLLSTDGQEWTSVAQVATTAAPVAVRQMSGSFSVNIPAPPPPPRKTASGPIGYVVAASPPVRALKQDTLGLQNLSLAPEARAAASSAMEGYDIHKIEHLNDGLLGNSHSWITGTDPSWAEIDLGQSYWIARVAFGSDTSGQHRDRAATSFRILTSETHLDASDDPAWTTVHRQSTGDPTHARTEFPFQPVRARWVRIAVDATNSPQVRIDELEIFGQQDPIPAEKIGPMPQYRFARPAIEFDKRLLEAFVGEEHAWLKTYGRADLSPRLVPYNGRVKEYPRHVGDDVLPLPRLSTMPILDGRADDAVWQEASRGVVRVADPYDFQAGPLATSALRAGWNDEWLLLAVETNRLLSSHLAVVSSADGKGAGVVAWTDQGLVFNSYAPEAEATEVGKPIPLEGRLDDSLQVWEARLPLEWFPNAREVGIRVGLGMGGRHTPNHGRALRFDFSSLAIAQVDEAGDDETFRLRIAAVGQASSLSVRTESPQSSRQAGSLSYDVTLKPGEVSTLDLPAKAGPIGPELNLSIKTDSGEAYSLHLFRYDPMARTLTLFAEMIDRFQAAGVDVIAERAELGQLTRAHAELTAGWHAQNAVMGVESDKEPLPRRTHGQEVVPQHTTPFVPQGVPPVTADRSRRRAAFQQARLAKRRLFFRTPELAPLERILFVKRHAFEPSHNYSVNLDSRFRGGGGICVLNVPRRDGRLVPADAELVELFSSGAGIARNPMADFDGQSIYFAHRAAPDDYYHVMRTQVDGSGLEQLTFGPFHDYWPCPLPSGQVAFISTRCRARFLCWRPQAAVMFRMNSSGGDIRPLSHANLSEWAPSVMNDGRLIWTRSEYVDKGADFSHTLWSMRTDGRKPELVFGNTIIQPNGYANGRQVPGTQEICCTLISHFGDLNGPIALVDINQGRFNPNAIISLTPEVPWPGMWPIGECFRDAVPIASDYFLVSHAPAGQFGLFVIDRHGNRELLYLDPAIGAMCPTPLRSVKRPPVIHELARRSAGTSEVAGAGGIPEGFGQLILADVYQGISPAVQRGRAKYLRVVEEVRAGLEQLADGSYRQDHDPFTHFYASPTDVVSGPYGWPSYVAKATWGLVPVEEDGSANFLAPAGKTLYLEVLDKDFNELQRMRSVLQLQSGERRSCVGCHEPRTAAPPRRPTLAMFRAPSELEPPSWGAGPFSYERVVQPVLQAKCVRCHDAGDKQGIDLTASLDLNRVPASYRTLISGGWIHYLDYGYNSGGNEKRQPLTFGSLHSRLWEVLKSDHHDVALDTEEIRRIKCWTDLNCPLWPDYVERTLRPMATR